MEELTADMRLDSEFLFRWLASSFLAAGASLFLHQSVPYYPLSATLFSLFDLTQVATAVAVGFLLIKVLRANAGSESARGQRRIGAVVLLLILALLFAPLVVFEEQFAATSFSRELGPVEKEIPEPPLTRTLESIAHQLGIEPPDDEISTVGFAPSGWVVRQTLLALLGTFLLGQNNLGLGRLCSRTLRVFLPVSVIYIALARIFRLRHTPLDVGTAVCVATLLFFFGLILTSSLGNWLGRWRVECTKSQYDLFLLFALGSIIILTVASLTYFWLVALYVFLIMIGPLYTLRGWKPTTTERV